MMRKYWPVLVVLVTVAALCLSCSTKKKVVTGTQYECKECGKVYRDDTREMEVDRRLAEELGVEVVEGYCPMCGDEPMTLDQTQHYKCPVCGGDGGTEVKKVTLERKLSDTVPTELEVAKACPTGKCAKVGRLHRERREVALRR
jgi:tRNA(Ile2) C34 agmatinyltransferase TiaS